MQPESTRRVELPDKLYFKVGEVSEITGLPAYVLRFWETEFNRTNRVPKDYGQQCGDS